MAACLTLPCFLGPLLIDGILRGINVQSLGYNVPFNSCMEPDSIMDIFLDIASPRIAYFIEGRIRATAFVG